MSRTPSKQSQPPTRNQPATKVVHQIALRVDDDLMNAIDAELERLRKERPGATIHRSDVVRELCWRALRGNRKS